MDIVDSIERYLSGATVNKGVRTRMTRARDEIVRLRAALDWYEHMAKQMQRATLHGDSQYMLGMMKELALDGGKRARDAMRPNAPDQADAAASEAVRRGNAL